MWPRREHLRAFIAVPLGRHSLAASKHKDSVAQLWSMRSLHAHGESTSPLLHGDNLTRGSASDTKRWGIVQRDGNEALLAEDL